MTYLLSRESIIEFASRYDNFRTVNDEIVEKKMKNKLPHQDYITRGDFIEIGKWKSPRPIRHYESNTENTVKEVSKIAFTTKDEEIKINILTTLKGCRYSVASAILHFKFPELYPIIDFRVMWSLWKMGLWEKEIKSVPNSFELWQKYAEEIRSLSKKYGLDIRTIEKGLWRYSKENQ